MGFGVSAGVEVSIVFVTVALDGEMYHMDRTAAIRRDSVAYPASEVLPERDCDTARSLGCRAPG